MITDVCRFQQHAVYLTDTYSFSETPAPSDINVGRRWRLGISTDKPTQADYDGDGKTDIAVYRPSNGAWYVLKTTDGGFSVTAFGTSADIPAPADYDGDGKTDYAVFRPAGGTWYIMKSGNSQVQITAFGSTGDVPAASNPKQQ